MENINHTFRRITDNFFSLHAILLFIACLGTALILGRIIAALLRRLVAEIGAHADRSQNLQTVHRLRRYETLIVISIATIKTVLVLIALYVWWQLDHPGNQSTALLGASAILAVVLSASLTPVLRDIAIGISMMAEQWYGVGDHIRVEPFADMQGVVDRVSLRSTRIRGLNGEVVWINNQYIQAVRITPRSTRTMALELFVNDVTAGHKLIEDANKRLPTGQLLVITPLAVVDVAEVGEKLWHITAMGETAPGREWLLEKSAVDLIRSLDTENAKPVIEHGPLFRYADSEADKRFIRTLTNARKKPAARRRGQSRRSK